MPSITIRYEFTREEAAHPDAAFGGGFGGFLRWFPWILLSAAWLWFFIATPPQRSAVELRLNCWATVFVIAVTLLGRMAKKKENPDVGKTITLIFDSEEVCQTKDGAEFRYPWNHVLKVRESSDGFLICPRARLVLWAPKHAFSSHDEVAALRDLIQKSGITIQRS